MYACVCVCVCVWGGGGGLNSDNIHWRNVTLFFKGLTKIRGNITKNEFAENIKNILQTINISHIELHCHAAPAPIPSCCYSCFNCRYYLRNGYHYFDNFRRYCYTHTTVITVATATIVSRFAVISIATTASPDVPGANTTSSTTAATYVVTTIRVAATISAIITVATTAETAVSTIALRCITEYCRTSYLKDYMYVIFF